MPCAGGSMNKCKYYDRCPYVLHEEDRALIGKSNVICKTTCCPDIVFAAEDLEKVLMDEVVIPFYDKVFSVAYKIIRFFGGK
jgi:hypothetical protein